MTTTMQTPRSELLETLVALKELHGEDYDTAVYLVKQRYSALDQLQERWKEENQWLA